MARKSNLGMSIDAVLAEANQRILREVISGLSGDTTLGALVSELEARGLNSQLMSLSIDEFASSRSGAPVSGKRAKAPAKTRGRKPRTKFNTRLESGRDALDEAMLEFLTENGPCRSESITKSMGVTTAQVRKSAQRLAKKGAVSITGNRRGTTYGIKKARKKSKKGKK